MKFITIALLMFGFTAQLKAQTQPQFVTINKVEWQKLAEITVPVGDGGAEIPIYEKEKYGSLHFKVTDAQLELKTVEINFENGERQDAILNDRLEGEKTSRNINLVGDRRIIKRVYFTYKSIPRTDDTKATVQLWATISTNAAGTQTVSKSTTTKTVTTKKRVVRKTRK